MELATWLSVHISDNLLKKIQMREKTCQLLEIGHEVSKKVLLFLFFLCILLNEVLTLSPEYSK